MRRLILTTALVSSLALVACGSEGDDAAPTSTQAPTTTAAPATTAAPVTTASGSEIDAYCAQLAGLDDGEDPGFDQFFTDHPEPALGDWAAFLPTPIAMLSDSILAFGNIHPPTEFTTEHAAVLNAMTAVRDSLNAGLEAAQAGDQAAFDSNGQAPGDVLDAAIATLGAECGLGG